MKRRFLLTIGIVMALAIGSVGVLQYILFRAEQYRLIDSRIEATATLLLSSDLTRTDLKDFDDAENIISEIVGGDRFNQFIIIYKRSGEEMYRSSNAEVLPRELPRDEKWQTIETAAGHFIRVLTLPLARPRPGKSQSMHDTRILQTGLILDQELVRMKTTSRHVLFFSVMILGLILLTTLWLAEVLLRPLKELASYLRHLSSKLELSPDMGEQAEPPEPPIRDRDDEFGLLVVETRRLRDMIGRGLKNTQAWTAQMAHEMKTPLTVLQNSLEQARTETDSVRRETSLKEASAEVTHLTALISSFLEWSAAENFPESEDLHAVRLGQVARELADKFDRQNPGRIKLDGDSNLRVFAKRGFAHQAISNLLTNAIRYSPAGTDVFMRIREDRVEIIDEGPGLPTHVLNQLGEPFNYGSKNEHGFGLGLAWVRTICRKYGWKLDFTRATEIFQGGKRRVTVASIWFPQDES